ncbi:unnamed protein product, partial [Mesorhabditis belari]|uniref:Uncharacterized protein n=1 Tax=Mesorhabditis belari TaxID=2138241 RepID=A0AAF3JA52_9BILA
MIWMPAAVLAVRYPADQSKPLGFVAFAFMLIVMSINTVHVLSNGTRIVEPTEQQPLDTFDEGTFAFDAFDEFGNAIVPLSNDGNHSNESIDSSNIDAAAAANKQNSKRK